MELDDLAANIGSSAAFALLGILVFGVAFYLMVKVAPFSIRKEIEEDHNTALAIIIAAVILGVGLIVAAAIHGDVQPVR